MEIAFDRSGSIENEAENEKRGEREKGNHNDWFRGGGQQEEEDDEAEEVNMEKFKAI